MPYTRFFDKYRFWIFVLVVGLLVNFLVARYHLQTAPISPILPYFVISLFLPAWEAGVGFLIATSYTTYLAVVDPHTLTDTAVIRIILLLFFFALIVIVKKRLQANANRRRTLERYSIENTIFRDLVNKSPYAIMVIDKANKVLLANNTLLDLIGFSSEELVNKSADTLVPDNLIQSRRETIADAFVKSQEKEQAYYHNISVRRKDGTIFLADLFTSEIDWNGYDALRVTLQDRTDINASEYTSYRKTIELEMIIKNNPLLTLLTNYEGDIIYANEKVFSLFGYSRIEIEDMRLINLVPEQYWHDHEKYRVEFWNQELDNYKNNRPNRDRIISGSNFYGRRKDGSTFKCDITLSWVIWQGELTSLAIVRDLTESIRLAREKDRADQAEASLKIRDRFISLAAHELKTPISSIVLYSDLLESYFQETMEKVTDYRLEFYSKKELTQQSIKAIQRQALNISLLVNQFLDVSLITSTQPLTIHKEHIKICKLLSEIVEFSRLQTKFHTLTLECEPDLDGFVDRLRAEQIIVNLLNNAIKYSPNGGEIRVNAWTTPSGELKITVRDHGLGIPPDKRGQIFTRFFRAHGDLVPGGLGLGLYLSREIMISHDGLIAFEDPSDEQGGTVFSITFPPNSIPSQKPKA